MLLDILRVVIDTGWVLGAKELGTIISMGLESSTPETHSQNENFINTL
jgi:hypothetical protein